ncbi:hypothetical protein [Qingshengfaniella alkalisoli]|uniref:Uncharacterized protein n=1 Tax=Qingshengfaniella alkalisoli TaxID=2599296 RepID=A0A5B8ICT9_9RHOB|nr:hypothetical protein [Qingshengfaniella alkalisoli]QDY71406.1 hypothetical protein FPZ52_17110 [Qingshengfaniella alkalisoli]
MKMKPLATFAVICLAGVGFYYWTKPIQPNPYLADEILAVLDVDPDDHAEVVFEGCVLEVTEFYLSDLRECRRPLDNISETKRIDLSQVTIHGPTDGTYISGIDFFVKDFDESIREKLSDAAKRAYQSYDLHQDLGSLSRDFEDIFGILQQENVNSYTELQQCAGFPVLLSYSVGAPSILIKKGEGRELADVLRREANRCQ